MALRLRPRRVGGRLAPDLPRTVESSRALSICRHQIGAICRCRSGHRLSSLSTSYSSRVAMSAGMEDPAAAAKRAALHDLTNKGAMRHERVRQCVRESMFMLCRDVCSGVVDGVFSILYSKPRYPWLLFSHT